MDHKIPTAIAESVAKSNGKHGDVLGHFRRLALREMEVDVQDLFARFAPTRILLDVHFGRSVPTPEEGFHGALDDLSGLGIHSATTLLKRTSLRVRTHKVL